MQKALRGLLFLVIIGLGVGGWFFLKATKPQPGKKQPENRSILVTTTSLAPAREQVSVSTMGTVIPAETVAVFPEVGGRIIYRHPNLEPGGYLRAGQVLVRIDPTDYDLAMEQAQAQVAQAELQLATEKGLKSVAEKEWALIREEVQPTEEGRKLALHEIQLQNAQVSLHAAKSSLELARLRRERTLVKAPFDCVVLEKAVDRGQVVTAATRIATLVASDRFWVQVSIPLDRLASVDIDHLHGKTGSPARIEQRLPGGKSLSRPGKVLRLLPDLDPKGRMARLLIEIEDPLGLHQPADARRSPILLDAYVHVHIAGPPLKDVFELPRLALRENGQVWLASSDNTLQIRKVEVAWRAEDQVYIRGPIQAGDRVITNQIATPVEGMPLRTTETDATHDHQPGESGPAVSSNTEEAIGRDPQL